MPCFAFSLAGLPGWPPWLTLARTADSHLGRTDPRYATCDDAQWQPASLRACLIAVAVDWFVCRGRERAKARPRQACEGQPPSLPLSKALHAPFVLSLPSILTSAQSVTRLLFVSGYHFSNLSSGIPARAEASFPPLSSTWAIPRFKGRNSSRQTSSSPAFASLILTTSAIVINVFQPRP